MAEASLSATEAALENQRIGPLQIRVAAICTLIQMCDGYDVNSIGVSVPSHIWTKVQIAATRICKGPIRWFLSALSVDDNTASAILFFLLLPFGWLRGSREDLG